MNKYILLTKTQLLEFVPKFLTKSKKSTKAASYGGFGIFGLILLAFAGVYEYGFIKMFELSGTVSEFPAFLAAVASLAILLTTFTSSRQMIFSFGKIDSALALPVSTSTVIAARLTIIYLYNLFFTVLIMLPCCVIYPMIAGFDAIFLLTYLLLMLFVPMIPIVIAAVIGAILAFASARFRYANVVNTVLLFAFLIVWIAFFTAIGFYSGSGEMVNIASKVKVFYPLFDTFTAAVGGKISALLLYIAVSAAFFIVFCLLFSKFFTSLQAAFSSRLGSAKYNYAKTGASAFKAVLQKEKAKFFSSSAYMANAGIGPVMLIIAGIALMIFRGRILGMVDGFAAEAGIAASALINIAASFVPIALIYFGGLGTVASCSISLEGQSFAIMKSSPVSGKTVIFAKLLFSSVLSSLPVLIVSLMIAFAFDFTALNRLCIIVTSTMYSYIASAFGLLINLKKYRFDYTNETQIIKQSFPVFITVIITLLTSFLITGVTVATLIFAPEYLWLTAICIASATVVAAAALTAILVKKGEDMYNRIEI